MKRNVGSKNGVKEQGSVGFLGNWRMVAAVCFGIVPLMNTWAGAPSEEARQRQVIRAVSKGSERSQNKIDYNVELVAELERASESGDAHAQRLLADVLVNGKPGVIGKNLARAKVLYKQAAEKGLAEGYIGEAELLLGAIVPGSTIPSEVEMLLSEASRRGVARADRLLSRAISEFSTEQSAHEQGWKLLQRAALRGDALALLEVGEASLEGTWKSLPVEVDAEHAEACFREAAKQGSAEGALRLSQYLMRDPLEIGSAVYKEAVMYLYYAYIWSHGKNEALIEKIDQMGSVSELQPVIWGRARKLYQLTIHPRDFETKSGGEGGLVVKTRKGKEVYLKIEGAESTEKPTYSLMGLPLDAFYLWDSTDYQITSNGVSVPATDPFWESACNQADELSVSWYLKLLDGPYAGSTLMIEDGWSPDSSRNIPLAAGFAKVLTGAETIALGYWRSLYSVFGEYNEIGLRPGLSGESADQILILNAEFQETDRYFFNSDLLSWASVDAPSKPVKDFIIPPWQGIVVLRREVAPLFLKLDGSRSEYVTSVPVDPGINVLTNTQYRYILDEMSASEANRGKVPAASIPIIRVEQLEDGASNLAISRESVPWWEPLGIGAGDPVYINRDSVFILNENPEGAPYLLQW